MQFTISEYCKYQCCNRFYRSSMSDSILFMTMIIDFTHGILLSFQLIFGSSECCDQVCCNILMCEAGLPMVDKQPGWLLNLIYQLEIRASSNIRMETNIDPWVQRGQHRALQNLFVHIMLKSNLFCTVFSVLLTAA